MSIERTQTVRVPEPFVVAFESQVEADNRKFGEFVEAILLLGDLFSDQSTSPKESSGTDTPSNAL